ncbi:MAG: CBS domain-containing protein [Gammaproteobacteria bacterium]
MARTFHPLPMQALAADIVVSRYQQGLPGSVTMEDEALDVMTDLLRVKVFTVAPDTLIDDALQKMIHAEVRLLIVTDRADIVLGVIAATDIMGERPIAISSAERIPRSAIRVEQIMTTRDDINALRMQDVEDTRVGDIVATLRGAGRQHAIVLDKDNRGRAILRGIFSTTQIARQLGVTIEADGKAQSFAELERALLA